MLSISLVFAVNDILALKSFNTFLNNFLIHEKPGFIERRVAKAAQAWIQARTLKLFKQVRKDPEVLVLGTALNEINADFLAILFLSKDSLLQPKTGEELFLCIAATELALKKLYSPKKEELYEKEKAPISQ